MDIDPKFGRCRVVRLLAKGGGAIYLARDPLESNLALKIWREGSGESELLQHFLGEVRRLARLAHPNLVKIVEAREYNDVWNIPAEPVPARKFPAQGVRPGWRNPRAQWTVASMIWNAVDLGPRHRRRADRARHR
jgi:hypothetical protein